jgi:hypothetical protein
VLASQGERSKLRRGPQLSLNHKRARASSSRSEQKRMTRPPANARILSACSRASNGLPRLSHTSPIPAQRLPPGPRLHSRAGRGPLHSFSRNGSAVSPGDSPEAKGDQASSSRAARAEM